MGFTDSSDPKTTGLDAVQAANRAWREQSPMTYDWRQSAGLKPVRKKGSRCTSRLRVLINTATTTHSFNGVAVQFRTALTGESGTALHNFPFTSKIR